MNILFYKSYPGEFFYTNILFYKSNYQPYV